jgi:hypothetical protein
MNVDQMLRFLAPLTPAVLPIMVFIWHRTRRELGRIRQELTSLREARVLPDPRLDELLEAVDSLRAELIRLGEGQRAALQLMSEHDLARLKPAPGAPG